MLDTKYPRKKFQDQNMKIFTKDFIVPVGAEKDLKSVALIKKQ